jgi:hypothetical protein
MPEVLILSQAPIQSHPTIVELEGICWEIKRRTEKAVLVLVFEKARLPNRPSRPGSAHDPGLQFSGLRIPDYFCPRDFNVRTITVQGLTVFARLGRCENKMPLIPSNSVMRISSAENANQRCGSYAEAAKYMSSLRSHLLFW